ncbi:hypothetical protein ANABIO32_02750 [Rossellomorea marisflavi]|nr:hypothetical protein ANABIO32_02750 [Rossellomorea marisflavi]
MSEYILSEEDCIKILETKPVNIKDKDTKSKDRINRASEILNKRS